MVRSRLWSKIKLSSSGDLELSHRQPGRQVRSQMEAQVTGKSNYIRKLIRTDVELQIRTPVWDSVSPRYFCAGSRETDLSALS